ncbi:unnamed protein product [Amoebophrya sp. A120]|nr:unnamed protein product [Amoebophrya sp. A120]|eukprot:GSA120T00019509001.1
MWFWRQNEEHTDIHHGGSRESGKKQARQMSEKEKFPLLLTEFARILRMGVWGHDEQEVDIVTHQQSTKEHEAMATPTSLTDGAQALLESDESSAVKNAVSSGRPPGLRREVVGNLIERVAPELYDEDPDGFNVTEYWRWAVSQKLAPTRKKGKAFLLEHYEHVDLERVFDDLSARSNNYRFRFRNGLALRGRSERSRSGLVQLPSPAVAGHVFEQKQEHQELHHQGGTEEDGSSKNAITYQYVSNLRECSSQSVSTFRQITHHHEQGAFADILHNQRELFGHQFESTTPDVVEQRGDLYPYEYRHLFPALDDAFFLDGHDVLNAAMHQEFLRRRLLNTAAQEQRKNDDKNDYGAAEAITNRTLEELPFSHPEKRQSLMTNVERFFYGASKVKQAGPLPFTFGQKVSTALHGENVFLSPLQEHLVGMEEFEQMVDSDARVWEVPHETIQAGEFAVLKRSKKERVEDVGALPTQDHDEQERNYSRDPDPTTLDGKMDTGPVQQHDPDQVQLELPDNFQPAVDLDFDRHSKYEQYTNLKKQMLAADRELQLQQKLRGAPFPKHLLQMHETKTTRVLGAATAEAGRDQSGAVLKSASGLKVKNFCSANSMLRFFGCSLTSSRFGGGAPGNSTWFNASFHAEAGNLVTDLATQFGKFSLQTNLISGRTGEVFAENEKARGSSLGGEYEGDQGEGSRATMETHPRTESTVPKTVASAAPPKDESQVLQHREDHPRQGLQPGVDLRRQRISGGKLTPQSPVHDTFGKGYSHFKDLSVAEDVKTFEKAVEHVLLEAKMNSRPDDDKTARPSEDEFGRGGARRTPATTGGGFAIIGVLDEYEKLMEMLECVFPTFFRDGRQTLKAGKLASNSYRGGAGEYFRDRGIVAEVRKKGSDDVGDQGEGVDEVENEKNKNENPDEVPHQQAPSALAAGRRKRYKRLDFLLDFVFGKFSAEATVSEFLKLARKFLTESIAASTELHDSQKVRGGTPGSAVVEQEDLVQLQTATSRASDVHTQAVLTTGSPPSSLAGKEQRKLLLLRDRVEKLQEVLSTSQHQPQRTLEEVFQAAHEQVEEHGQHGQHAVAGAVAMNILPGGSFSARNDTALLNLRYQLVSLWNEVFPEILQLGPKFPLARVRTFHPFLDSNAMRYISNLENHKTAQEQLFSKFMRKLFGGWCRGSPDDLLYRIAKKRFLRLYEHARSQISTAGTDGDKKASRSQDILNSPCCRKFVA